MMTPANRRHLINSVRERRTRDRFPGDPEAPYFDALLEEIDEQYQQLLDARAKVSELAAKLAEARQRQPSEFSPDEITRLRDLARPDAHSWANGRWG
jgi:oligoendopeptidase F